MKRFGFIIVHPEHGQDLASHQIAALEQLAPHLDACLVIGSGMDKARASAHLSGIDTRHLTLDRPARYLAAYRSGLTFLSANTLDTFDEFLFTDLSYFTTGADLGDMLSYMATRQLDIWAATGGMHHDTPWLDSYFLIAKRTAVTSASQARFWQAQTAGDDPYPLQNKELWQYLSQSQLRCGVFADRLIGDPQSMFSDSWNVVAALEAKTPFVHEDAVLPDRNDWAIPACYSSKTNLEALQAVTGFDSDTVWQHAIRRLPADVLINVFGLQKIAREPNDAYFQPSACHVVVTLRCGVHYDLVKEALGHLHKGTLYVAAPKEGGLLSRLKQDGFRAKEISHQETGLCAWRAELLSAVSRDSTIIHLEDFDDEIPISDHTKLLFNRYWGTLLEPAGLNTAMDWFDSHPHLGMIFPSPNLVQARRLRTQPISRYANGWDFSEYPEPFPEALDSIIWPWRGIAAIRGAVFQHDQFGESLENLEAACDPSRVGRCAGPEGFWPEVVRSCGFASGIILLEDDVIQISLTQSLLNQNKSIALLGQARDLAALIQKKSFQDLKYFDDHLPQAQQKSARLDRAPHGQYSFVSLTLGETEISRVPIGADIRISLDSFELRKGIAHLRGWALNSAYPSDRLYCAVFKNDLICGQFQLVKQQRLDVLAAFDDDTLSGNHGFLFEVEVGRWTMAKQLTLAVVSGRGASYATFPLGG